VTLSGDCSWEEDLIIAKLVAKKLDIPLHVVDSSEDYKRKVVEYMLGEYEKGRTPNPDVLCNKEIKFDVFIQKAKEIGADYFATGHYCRKEEISVDGKKIYRLLAGSDPNKDQSYFLCQLSQDQIKDVLFPIGHLLKPEVRKIAAELELASAKKKDSQGICFVGKVDLPTFLQQKLKPKKGDIIEISKDKVIKFDHQVSYSLDEKEAMDSFCSERSFRPADGKKVGEHNGAFYYTIGQRKGLDVGGTPEPLFIIATDIEMNIVYVVQGKDHPGLFRKGLFIKSDDIHWIRPDLELKHDQTDQYRVRIRYRQDLQDATIYQREEGIFIVFDRLQRGITPGQFAAWYKDDELLGSGIIS
jgi:tRNA-specific 2-thiouridylase